MFSRHAGRFFFQSPFSQRFMSSRSRFYSSAEKLRKAGAKQPKYKKPQTKVDPKILNKNSTPNVIPLYSNPYNLFDKVVYGLLGVQVVLTTGAVIYISTPIQEYFPLPESIVERFVPPPDPENEEGRQMVIDATAKKWFMCLMIGWICSCLALYFKRTRFKRIATGARLIQSSSNDTPMLLEIDYFFNKSKQYASRDIIKESFISKSEWGIVVKPDKPFTFFSFEEDKLSEASRQMMLNFMHNQNINNQTLATFDMKSDTIQPKYDKYVYGKDS